MITRVRYFLLVVLIGFSIAGLNACKPGDVGGSDSTQKFEEAIASGKPLVKIGDSDIREGYLETLGKINPQLKTRLATPMGRKQILESLTDQELLYKASLKENLGSSPDVLEKIGFYTRMIVGQAYIENELKKRVAEYYDAHKKDEFEQVQLSHLYVKFDKNGDKADKKDKSEKPADKAAPPVAPEALKAQALANIQALQKQLQSGADFIEVVKVNSDDMLTKKTGGSLGWVSRNDQRLGRKNWQALLDKAFAMKPGDVSEIIETDKGYHLIKVTEGPKVLPLLDVEGKIRANLGGSLKKDVIAQLKKDVTVEYLDKADEKVKEGNAAEGAKPVEVKAGEPAATIPKKVEKKD